MWWSDGERLRALSGSGPYLAYYRIVRAVIDDDLNRRRHGRRRDGRRGRGAATISEAITRGASFIGGIRAGWCVTRVTVVTGRPVIGGRRGLRQRDRCARHVALMCERALS